jgi:CRP-like cAMP-binding protein
MNSFSDDFLKSITVGFKNRFPEMDIDALISLFPISEIIHVRKKEYYIETGQYTKNIVFIIKGIFRAFFLKEETEHTVWLRKEFDVFASYQSVLRNTPSNITFQAIEDSIIVVINYDLMKNKVLENVNVAKNMFIVYENLVLDLIESLEGYATLTTEERFQKLIENNAEITQRVPQHQLATILGVTPESLSRIKSRMRFK